jgi:hypothetical protein
VTARLRARAWCALGLAVIGVVLGLTGSRPAEAQTPDDPTLTFQWADPRMKEAFGLCLDVVAAVAQGHIDRAPGNPAMWPWQHAPAGIDDELWKQAVNSGFFRLPRLQQFTYRPHCDRLLPDNYETQISIRFYSEVYTRCLAMVGGDANHARPKVVPAWYWFVSLEIRDCHLLLPRGAFGLGPDQNDWSEWRTEDEVTYPTTHSDPKVMEEYHLCLEFIDWRMDNGQARNPFDPLGDTYDDPPRDASPRRAWHEAIDFFTDHSDTSHAGGTMTVPANWHPNCELLLTVESCTPSGPANPSLLPEACIGPHPISHYDIGYSQYDDPEERGTPSISRNIWGASTQYAFMIGKGATQVALWAVDWAYNFDIKQYNPLAIRIGDQYDALVNNPRLRLRELFWLILVSWAGFTAFRGRMGMAGSEVLVTIVLLLLAGFLFQNRVMYMNATWRLMNDAETSLLVAGMGGNPGNTSGADRTQVIRDLQKHIEIAFVEEPYDYLNWGRSLGDANDTQNPLRACAAARYYILGRGPHGADRWPRQQMAAAGAPCRDLVEFNRNPDGTRLLGAILVMLSSLTVAVMLIVMGLTVVVAKIIAMLLFAIVPFMLLVAVLPGHGRRWLWSGAATYLQVNVADIGIAWLLSLMLLTLNELIKLTDQVDLIERFTLMNLIVLIVFAARRSLLHSGQRFAARLSEYLSSPRGGSTTWASAAASAGPGLDLMNVDRTAFYAGFYGVGGPVGLAGRSVILRAQERRVARRSYRNLQRVAEWKRARNAPNERWRARHPGRNVRSRLPFRRMPTRRMPLP